MNAPWYRQRALVYLLAGPAIVVVASLVTAWVAWKSEDGLVADDYYKRGLAINRTLSREARAAALHLAATLQYADGRLRVVVAGERDAAPVTLHFAHPTRAALDRTIPLARASDGAYVGQWPSLAAGRWDVALESAAWRLTGEWNAPGTGVLTLRAGQPVGE
jgi:hypothetical protein